MPWLPQKREFALSGPQHPLAASKEAWRKAEDEASRIGNKRVSLLLKLGASKDELAGVRAEVAK